MTDSFTVEKVKITDTHTALAKWITDTSGFEVSPTAVGLALLGAPLWRKTPEYTEWKANRKTAQQREAEAAQERARAKAKDRLNALAAEREEVLKFLAELDGSEEPVGATVIEASDRFAPEVDDDYFESTDAVVVEVEEDEPAPAAEPAEPEAPAPAPAADDDDEWVFDDEEDF